jgi:hypothetical protein
VATGPIILANAWGGAWAAAWAGAWGNDWGQFTAEIDEDEQYYGGGGRRYRFIPYDFAAWPRAKKTAPVVDEETIRKQWELLELRLKNQAENARVIAEEARAREAAQQKAAPLWRDTESIDIQQARDDEEVALLLTLYMEM